MHIEALQYYSKLDLYVFAKNKQGAFIFCNEKFAEVAGADSPSQLIGKNELTLT